MIHEKTAATLVVGDVLSNNGAVIDQVVPCGHGQSVYIRAKFDDGYTQVVTVAATTPITTWTPDDDGGITPEGLALGHRYVMGNVNAYCRKCSDEQGVAVLDCDYDLDK